MGINLFVAFTSYHLLLSYAIALREEGKRNVLFVVPEFFGATEMVRLMQAQNTPFEDIILLLGSAEDGGTLDKIIKRKRNIRHLAKWSAKKHIVQVLVGNDARPEAQFLLFSCKKRNSSCRGVYIEDGSDAYRSFALKKSLFLHWAGKVIFGWWWRNITFLGITPWIDEIRAIFPELLRPELRNIPTAAIQKQDFLKLGAESWARRYISAAGLRPADLQEPRVLIILSHSDILKTHPYYRVFLREIFSLCKEKNIAVATKFHPKESSEELFQLPKNDIFFIPKAIPFELVYMFLPKVPQLVLGDISTSLLTARWIFEDAKILSLASLFSYADEYLSEVFSKTGIQKLKTNDDVAELLNKS